MLPELLISKFRSRIRSYLRSQDKEEIDSRLYLHSRRRYLINSIPLFSIVALLVGFGISIMPGFFGLSFSVFGFLGWFNGECYAVDTSTSLQVVTPELSGTIIPNTTSYLSSEVVYSAENVENYALQISYAEGSNSLKSESGNTTIADTNSNTPGTLAKNTWGYAWGDTNTDNTTLTYQAMPAYGNAKTIEQGTADISSTTKKIVFAANLGDNIPTGHYKTNVLLSLVATPKVAVTAKWSNGVDSGIEYMQEIGAHFCTNNSSINIGDTIILIDYRDKTPYKIIKWDDGKCWMYTNLVLHTDSPDGMILDSTYSDIESGTFTLPQSKEEGFSSNTATNAYYATTSEAGATGYYTWCAATAGTAGGCIGVDGTTLNPTTAISDTDATNSICPKNWKLPIGGTSSRAGSFYYLISTQWKVPSSAAGSDTMRNDKGFAYTGRIVRDSLGYTDSYGNWWSRTPNNSDVRYLSIFSSRVDPGNNLTSRFVGNAIRCVAEEPKEFTLTFNGNPSTLDNGNGTVRSVPAAQTCTTSSNSCTIEITTEKVTHTCPPSTGISFLGWNTNSAATSATYLPGSSITLTSNTTLYAIYSKRSSGSVSVMCM